MARGRFKSLSVTLDVYEKLKRIAEKRGFATLADTIAYLVTLEEEVYSKLEKALRDISIRPQATSTNPVNTYTSINTTSKPSKRSAWDILVEQKMTCISGIRRGNPNAIIEFLKKKGAVIVRTDKDVCAVLPEFWFEFKKRLNDIKTPNDEEVLSRLEDDRMRKLFTMLRDPGALYFEKKSKEWVYDYSFIEEPSLESE